MLDKNIKDYENESQKIVIEIFPVENKDCKFINIAKKNISYYHIYFNDNYKEEEEKRICTTKKEKIKKEEY